MDMQINNQLTYEMRYAMSTVIPKQQNAGNQEVQLNPGTQADQLNSAPASTASNANPASTPSSEVSCPPWMIVEGILFPEQENDEIRDDNLPHRLLPFILDPDVAKAHSDKFETFLKLRIASYQITESHRKKFEHEQGNWATLFAILNIESIQQKIANAVVNEVKDVKEGSEHSSPLVFRDIINLLLHALDRDDIPNALELLKLPFVWPYEQEILLKAAERGHWLVIIEILKHRKDEALNRLAELKTLSDLELNPVNLVLNDATEEAFLEILPTEMRTRVVGITDNLILQFASMKGYSKLLSKLLEKSIIAKNPRVIGSALRLAVKCDDTTGMQLLTRQARTMYAEPNLLNLTKDYWFLGQALHHAFNHAVYTGNWPMVVGLLKHQMVGSKKDREFDDFITRTDINNALYFALFFEQWKEASEILQLIVENSKFWQKETKLIAEAQAKEGRVIPLLLLKDNPEGRLVKPDEGIEGTEKYLLTMYDHQVLKMALKKENITMICQLVKAYQDLNIPLPQDLNFLCGPIDTLEARVNTTYEGLTELMNTLKSPGFSWPHPLSQLTFIDYADLSPTLNPRVEPVLFRGPYTRRKEDTPKVLQKPALLC